MSELNIDNIIDRVRKGEHLRWLPHDITGIGGINERTLWIGKQRITCVELEFDVSNDPRLVRHFDACNSIVNYLGITPEDGWPCACVRRDSEGNLDAAKIHPITTRRCRACKAERPEFGKYYCSACGQLLDRDSDKAWIKSYCDRSGRTVRVHRV